MRPIFILMVLFSAFPANSLEIHDVKYDKVVNNVMIDLSYFGGCARNEFKLILDHYNKSNPPQIAYRIRHTTPDTCKKNMRSIEAFEVPEAVREGDFFTILDNIPNNQSRTGRRGLCIPECRKHSNDSQQGLLKKFRK